MDGPMLWRRHQTYTLCHRPRVNLRYFGVHDINLYPESGICLETVQTYEILKLSKSLAERITRRYLALRR